MIQVAHVSGDSRSPSTGRWHLTLHRTDRSCSVPPASDLPSDVREALHRWLDTVPVDDTVNYAGPYLAECGAPSSPFNSIIYRCVRPASHLGNHQSARVTSPGYTWPAS